MGYRVVWTLQQGIAKGRVPLDVINEHYVEQSVEAEALAARQERDPWLTLREWHQEERAHRTPQRLPGSERIDNMLKLASRRRA